MENEDKKEDAKKTEGDKEKTKTDGDKDETTDNPEDTSVVRLDQPFTPQLCRDNQEVLLAHLPAWVREQRTLPSTGVAALTGLVAGASFTWAYQSGMGLAASCYIAAACSLVVYGVTEGYRQTRETICNVRRPIASLVGQFFAEHHLVNDQQVWEMHNVPGLQRHMQAILLAPSDTYANYSVGRGFMALATIWVAWIMRGHLQAEEINEVHVDNLLQLLSGPSGSTRQDDQKKDAIREKAKLEPITMEWMASEHYLTNIDLSTLTPGFYHFPFIHLGAPSMLVLAIQEDDRGRYYSFYVSPTYHYVTTRDVASASLLFRTIFEAQYQDQDLDASSLMQNQEILKVCADNALDEVIFGAPHIPSVHDPIPPNDQDGAVDDLEEIEDENTEEHERTLQPPREEDDDDFIEADSGCANQGGNPAKIFSSL